MFATAVEMAVVIIKSPRCYVQLSERMGLGHVPRQPGQCPKEWMDPEGVWPQGLRFCHTGGFLAVFDTIFDAINAVEELLGIKKTVEEEEDLDEVWAREWLKVRRKRSYRPYRRRWRR